MSEKRHTNVMGICDVCWNTPCVCGKAYAQLSEANLNILIHNLYELARRRGYVIDFNEQIPAITPISLIELLTRQEQEVVVPEKFINYLVKQGTPDAAWENIGYADIAYKSVLALALYGVAINRSDNSYDRFVVAVIEKYHIIPDALVGALKSIVDHSALMYQISTLLYNLECAKEMTDEMKLSYVILIRLFRIMDQNVFHIDKLRYLVSIINILSGVNTPQDYIGSNEPDACYNSSILVDVCNVLPEYDDTADEDKDVLELFKQFMLTPYYGQIPITL